MKKEQSLPKNVIALGMVSFFTDFSSEMIYPLLPLFLTSVLSASAVALGVIEGVAETTASILKLVSGIWADRTTRRKPFVFSGYTLSGIARPLIGLAVSWPFVLVMRFFDRVGKGIRTSPRDALIADTTPAAQRGEAYGFHRAMDHAGAVIGPIAAALLIWGAGMSLRNIFFLAAIPSIVVIIVIVLFVKEKARSIGSMQNACPWWGNLRGVGSSFKRFLVAMGVFTLGNSTDAFLLLRLSYAGIEAGWIAVIWSAHSMVRMATAYVGGRLSDIYGRKRMILLGWSVYALIYLSFAVFSSKMLLVVIFLLYGAYYGLTEPSEKAWISELVQKDYRGSAFGYYHFVVGISAMPASVIFGAFWKFCGVGAAFSLGAMLATVASVILLSLKKSGNYR